MMLEKCTKMADVFILFILHMYVCMIDATFLCVYAEADGLGWLESRHLQKNHHCTVESVCSVSTPCQCNHLDQNWLKLL